MAHPEEEAYRLTEMLVDGAMKDDDACRQALLALAKHSMEKVGVLAMCDDRQAIERLIFTLRSTLDRLEDEWRKSPQNYTHLASISDRWPALFYRKDSTREEAHNFILDTLKAGDSFPLDLSRDFNEDAIGTAVAVELFNRMENIDQLPPLSTSTAKAWWNAAKPVFFKLFGEEFQNHPAFEEFQKNEKYNRLDAGLVRSQMRSDIVGRVEQGFESIGRKVPKKRPQ